MSNRILTFLSIGLVINALYFEVSLIAMPAALIVAYILLTGGPSQTPNLLSSKNRHHVMADMLAEMPAHIDKENSRLIDQINIPFNETERKLLKSILADHYYIGEYFAGFAIHKSNDFSTEEIKRIILSDCALLNENDHNYPKTKTRGYAVYSPNFTSDIPNVFWDFNKPDDQLLTRPGYSKYLPESLQVVEESASIDHMIKYLLDPNDQLIGPFIEFTLIHTTYDWNWDKIFELRGKEIRCLNSTYYHWDDILNYQKEISLSERPKSWWFWNWNYGSHLFDSKKLSIN